MLSAIIITKNEATHIGDCLESIQWVDEIIVLDSGSSDETIDICRRYTNHVYQTDWPGFGLQKQRALEKASHKWVLSLDADEQISETLKSEIVQAMQNDHTQGFFIPRLSSYCGATIKHGGWWPDYVLRLFQKSSGQFTNDVVHERVIVEGKIQKLTSPILHEAFIDSAEVLEKINRYSTLGANKLLEKGKKSSLTTAILKGLWTFFKTYILKGALLDGNHGLMLSISNAEGAYYKYIKLMELTKPSK